MRVLIRLAAAFSLLLGCGDGAREPAPTADSSLRTAPMQTRDRVDVHVHLVGDVVDELLAALDRNGIAQAAVLASPHLDPDYPSAPGDDHFAGWRASNDRLLRETAVHRDRLLPFVTVDPATLAAGELERWLERGACGVKLYVGHRSLHDQALDHPDHAATFELLERRAIPVLLHVNTFRYEHELDALLTRYPKLQVVCPHLCGSRTNLDRLERIMRNHPSLRVDTSHGPGQPGIDGFANLERERERLRALIEAEPHRFMFGSDLVTMVVARNLEATRFEWDLQLAANLGLLERERFEFSRSMGLLGSAAPGEYRGLALRESVLAQVLAGNARYWLRGCLGRGAPPSGG